MVTVQKVKPSTSNTLDAIRKSLDSANEAVKFHTRSEIIDAIAAVLDRIEWIDKALKEDPRKDAASSLRSDVVERQLERMHLIARLSVYTAYIASETGSKPSDWM